MQLLAQGKVAESIGLLFMSIFSSAMMKCQLQDVGQEEQGRQYLYCLQFVLKDILWLLKIAKFVAYKCLNIKLFILLLYLFLYIHYSFWYVFIISMNE